MTDDSDPQTRALRRFLGIVQACFVCAAVAAGEPPQLEYLFPAGGQQGSTFLVLAGGRLEPWPVKVWTDDPGLAFRDEDGRGRFQVEISPKAAPGPHLVRVFTPAGASAPRIFVVGQAPEQSEGEFGGRTDSAERIDQLPLTINGRLRIQGETHVFAVRVESGYWLRAAVEAAGLDSSLRVSVVCLDEKGEKQRPNQSGGGVDPVLAWSIARTGVYRLQVSAADDSAKSAGGVIEGQAAVYRLNLSSEPVEAPAPVPVGPGAGDLPAEGNRLFRLGQQLQFPSTVHGAVYPSANEMRYGFATRQGEQYYFKLHPNSQGATVAPVLRVLDEAGHTYAQSRPAAEPELVWTAPAEGLFTIAVTSARGQGGGVCMYDLELGQPQPAFTGSTPEHTFRLQPGKSAEFTVSLVRPKFYEGPVTVTVIGLPDGVTGTAGPIPPEGGRVTVTLNAAAEAKPANQPFRVAVVAPNLAVPQVTVLTAPLKGRYAAAGELLLNETEHLWVTVLPASER
jgi:hypothetical protein